MEPAGGAVTTAQQGGAEHEAPWPTAGTAWYAVAVLFVAVIFSFVDRIILSLLVDPIKQDLGLTDTHFGFLLGVAFAAFLAIFGLPIGFIVIWAVSLMTPAPSQQMQEFIDQLRIPRGEILMGDAKQV